MQFARKIVLLSAVVMMGAAGGAAAKENDLTNATKPVSVVTVEGMTEYRLPNGLRVVLYPDMSKPTATVNMIERSPYPAQLFFSQQHIPF